ncbi:hypothetical protein KSP39_PZI002267 [Platanthera zijinensis]|uniref:Uncharacterized protein n=1 Tax=Platanthera zijinensis TaxID=2320716 RepID=A0AAP0GDW2_9ASPA
MQAQPAATHLAREKPVALRLDACTARSDPSGEGEARRRRPGTVVHGHRAGGPSWPARGKAWGAAAHHQKRNKFGPAAQQVVFSHIPSAERSSHNTSRLQVFNSAHHLFPHPLLLLHSSTGKLLFTSAGKLFFTSAAPSLLEASPLRSPLSSHPLRHHCWKLLPAGRHPPNNVAPSKNVAAPA